MSDFVKDTNVPTNDIISRQEAIDALRTHERKASHKWFDNQLDIEWNNAIDICCYDIEDLPSAQPERIKGHWVEIASSNHTYKCSVCGRLLVNITDGKNNVAKNYPYCHCGADMRGEEECC